MRYALNIVVNRPLVFFIDSPSPSNYDIVYDITKSPAFPLLFAFRANHYVPVLRECLLRSLYRQPAIDAMNGAPGKLVIGTISTYGVSPFDIAQLVEDVEEDDDESKTKSEDDKHHDKVRLYVSHLTLEPTKNQVLAAAKTVNNYLVDLINSVCKTNITWLICYPLSSSLMCLHLIRAKARDTTTSKTSHTTALLRAGLY